MPGNVAIALIIEATLIVWLVLLNYAHKKNQSRYLSNNYRRKIKHIVYYHHLPLFMVFVGYVSPDYIALAVAVWAMATLAFYYYIMRP